MLFTWSLGIDTMPTKFEIVDCCGDHVEFVELVVPADIGECDLAYEYEEEVLAMAGYRNYDICDTCGSQVYSVRLA